MEEWGKIDVMSVEMQANHKQTVRRLENGSGYVKKPTFASLLAASHDTIQISDQLPLPVQRGDSTVVRIDPELHKLAVHSCRNNLIGRIMLKQGSIPMKLEEARFHLQKIWHPCSVWLLTPLPRGFLIYILMMRKI